MIKGNCFKVDDEWVVCTEKAATAFLKCYTPSESLLLNKMNAMLWPSPRRIIGVTDIYEFAAERKEEKLLEKAFTPRQLAAMQGRYLVKKIKKPRRIDPNAWVEPCSKLMELVPEVSQRACRNIAEDWVQDKRSYPYVLCYRYVWEGKVDKALQIEPISSIDLKGEFAEDEKIESIIDMNTMTFVPFTVKIKKRTDKDRSGKILEVYDVQKISLEAK